jgi:hypothetical protein
MLVYIQCTLFYQNLQVPDTGEICVLHVSVEVDLDDTVRDGLPEVLDTAAAASVEDEEDGLFFLGTDLLLDESLVLLEELRAELDVAGLVHSVDVAESSSNAEVWRDGGECLVDVPDVLGLGVERVVVDVLVVDTVLLATSDADLHLEPLLHWRRALEVLLGGLDVLINSLFGKIDHVAGEEGFAMLLEVCLIRL